MDAKGLVPTVAREDVTVLAIFLAIIRVQMIVIPGVLGLQPAPLALIV